MKNEPIIAYDHLQEEQDEKSHALQHEHAHYTWRLVMNPVAITIEIAAIIAMAIFMIEELFH